MSMRKATDQEIIDAIARCSGNKTRAAELLGLEVRSFKRRVKRMEQDGRLDSLVVPSFDDDRTIYQTTTQVDSQGNIERQWQRAALAERERLRREAMQAFVDELVSTMPARKRVAAGKTKRDRDLMVGYPIGDHHFGMYAWAAETGEGFNLDRAKELLADATDYLVGRSDPAEEALLCNLGDFLHVDDSTNKTRKHGHLLDVAGRHREIARAAAFSLAYATERLLAKHKRVKIVCVPGNHDEDSAGWLSLFLVAWFRNEPRVTVETSPSFFLFHEFGRNMICMTHGHTVKLPDLPGKMAALEPGMWGRTSYRVGWTGHVHHAQTVFAKDNHGARAESFGVLPPRDAHAASLGLTAQREMHAIHFKRSGGELCRITFNAELS